MSIYYSVDLCISNDIMPTSGISGQPIMIETIRPSGYDVSSHKLLNITNWRKMKNNLKQKV